MAHWADDREVELVEEIKKLNAEIEPLKYEIKQYIFNF